MRILGKARSAFGLISVCFGLLVSACDNTPDHPSLAVTQLDTMSYAAQPSPTNVPSTSLLAPTAYQVMADIFAGATAFNYGLDKVRFINPVKVGARVRNRIKLLAVEPKGDGRWLLTSENTFEIEGEDKPALIAVSLVMILPG